MEDLGGLRASDELGDIQVLLQLLDALVQVEVRSHLLLNAVATEALQAAASEHVGECLASRV